MNSAWTIFKKELTHTLRDRRTIITMIIFPLLLFPVIMTVITGVTQSQIQKAEAAKLQVAVIANGNAQAQRLAQILADDDGIELQQDVPEDSIRSRILAGKLDGAFVFESQFDAQIDSFRAGNLQLFFKAAENLSVLRNRLRSRAEDFEKQLLADRFSALQIDKNMVEVLAFDEVNIASEREKFGSVIGGFLPYIFILFCFLGSMYPAIDLAAGEKERHTMETLLTTPASRYSILLGKFGVVVLSGLLSAIISIVGLYIGFQQSKGLPDAFIRSILNIFEWQTLIMVLSLLLPMAIFFAGILLSISLFTRTYKEAQSAISPLVIFAIIPGIIGTVPGITLNAQTALIPILNVTLATKHLLSGGRDVLLLSEVYLSMFVLGLLSLYLASKMFTRESVIFRN
ncbi:MAG: ABC transporter permease subunit [Calditrichia bacterium]|nr:ABC transporter permease [Calditrichia bacterium]